MSARQEERASESPLVARITRVRFEADWRGFTTPDGCWDIVVRKVGGRVHVLQTGIITRPVELSYSAGDEYLSISFKPGVFMPQLPGSQMVDCGLERPTPSSRSFWLDQEQLEIPTFDNAEGLVERLVARGLLVRDEIVEGVVDRKPRAVTPRSMQRHFLRALGITAKQLAQIERACRAVELLGQGRRVIDVALELGYADQAHMTRALKVLVGRTPGLKSLARDERHRRVPNVVFLQGGARGPRYFERMKTTPFRIDVPQSTLDDLQRRLAQTRWPEQPEGAGWGLGTDLGFMRRMTERWLSHYDWRVQETALNAHPQFKADVDGTELHFVHVRGKGKNPTPLLLLHAFPDSFYRFHKVIPLLTDPGAHGLDPNLKLSMW